MTQSIPRRLRLAVVLALALSSIPSAAHAGSSTITGGNPYYEFIVGGTDRTRELQGMYGVQTGPSHPVTSAVGRPGLLIPPSFDFLTPDGGINTVRSWDSGTDYVLGDQPTFGIISIPGYSCVRLRTLGPVETEPIRSGSQIVGGLARWRIDRDPDHLLVEQTVQVVGDSLVNSAAQISLRVMNEGPHTAHLGLRYFWDLTFFGRLGPPPGSGTAGAYLASRPPDPPGEPYPGDDRDWLSPLFRAWEASETAYPSQGVRLYLVAGTVAGPATLSPPPTPPSLLRFDENGRQTSLIDGLWDYCFDGPSNGPRIPNSLGVDRGISYLWGHQEHEALVVPPGEEVTVTQYVVAYLEYPLTCRVGGPYRAECAQPSTSVLIEGAADVSEPGTDALVSWSSPSTALTFDEPESASTLVRAPGPGSYPIALDASVGAFGCRAESNLEIVDTTPPTSGSITATPPILWPPDHRMVPVRVQFQALDLCDPSPRVELISASSSEPDDANGTGDGATVGDIQGASIGTDDREVLLRAERDGTGRGRVYTLSYRIVDASGNQATAQVKVRVPHDLRDRTDRTTIRSRPARVP